MDADADEFPIDVVDCVVDDCVDDPLEEVEDDADGVELVEFLKLAAEFLILSFKIFSNLDFF